MSVCVHVHLAGHSRKGALAGFRPFVPGSHPPSSNTALVLFLDVSGS